MRRLALFLTLFLAFSLTAREDLRRPEFLAGLTTSVSGGPFAPTNMQSWYRDAYITTNSSNAVIQWSDQSGNNWNLTNFAFLNRTPFQSNTLNGNPVLSFITGAFLGVAGGSNGPTCEFWAVCKNRTNNAAGGTLGPFITSPDASHYHNILPIVGAQWRINAGAYLLGPTVATFVTNWHVFMCRFDNNGNAQIWTNGVLAAGGGSTGTQYQNGTYVNSTQNLSDLGCRTDYAEMIFYNGTNNAANTALIFNYLTNRYALGPPWNQQ